MRRKGGEDDGYCWKVGEVKGEKGEVRNEKWEGGKVRWKTRIIV